MKAVAVIGNPKAASRTRDAAERLAAGLGADCEVIEVSALGPALLSWGDPEVAAAIQQVQVADIVIAASPTYKATYTGLLKLFLDQFAGRTGMARVVGIPLMLGAAPNHALAADLTLKPVLVEVGATCPAAGLYQIDSSYDTDDSLDAWLAQWRDAVIRATGKA